MIAVAIFIPRWMFPERSHRYIRDWLAQGFGEAEAAPNCVASFLREISLDHDNRRQRDDREQQKPRQRRRRERRDRAEDAEPDNSDDARQRKRQNHSRMTIRKTSNPAQDTCHRIHFARRSLRRYLITASTKASAICTAAVLPRIFPRLASRFTRD